MTNTDIGKLGENIASKYLKSNGYKILETNVHISHNEIDIIAKDSEYIIFVEVKTRSTGRDLYSKFGSPASAVNYGKINRTIQAAKIYLSNHSFNELQPRFDVIEIYLDINSHNLLNVNHIINAFGA